MISIIIPCRDEADTLWFTLNSLQMHTRGTLVERDGIEIIVADNAPGAKGCGRTVQEVCLGFGASDRFHVRYVAAGEIQSPYYPRMKGAEAAKGEHLIFLDAHVLLSPLAIEALHENYLAHMEDVPKWVQRPEIYMTHMPVAFDRQSRLFGAYKLRLRNDFWGGWEPMSSLPGPGSSLGPWRARHPIGASGIWCVSTSKRSWGLVRGFNPNFKGYAGGEVYLQLKHWLLGGLVTILREPGEGGGLLGGVHWSAPRRYAAGWPDRLRNVLLGVNVVAPDVLPEVTVNLSMKSGIKGEQLSALKANAELLAATEASWMNKERVIGTTEELEDFWMANRVFF